MKASLIGIVLGFIGVLVIPAVIGTRTPQIPDPHSYRSQEQAQPREQAAQPPAAAPPQEARPGRVKTAEVEVEAQPEADTDEAQGNAETGEETDADDGAAAEGEPEPNGSLNASVDGKQDAEEGSTSDSADKSDGDAETAEAPEAVVSDDLPFPRTFTKQEMDAALKPLLDYKISDADAKALKKVFSLLGKRKYSEARAAIDDISDKSARTFATWQHLRLADLGATASEIETFVEKNPMFPSENVLAARLETALFWHNASAPRIAKLLGTGEPETGVGKALQGQVLLAIGERKQGIEQIRSVWRTSALDGALKSKFLARFGEHLTAEDHELREKAREFQKSKNKISLSTPAAEKRGLTRSQKGRSHRKKSSIKAKKKKAPAKRRKKKRSNKQSYLANPSVAVSMMASVIARSIIPQAAAAPDEKGVAPSTAPLPERKPGSQNGEATAVALPEKRPGDIPEKDAPLTAQQKAAKSAIALKKEVSAEPARLYARIRQLRRTNNHKHAWTLIRSMPPEASDLLAPETWWNERRIHVREALNAGRFKTAYAIARDHGPLSGDTLAEAEFMAGWVAYRYMKDPARAEEHFRASKAADGLPRDIARGAYFLGRVKKEQNRLIEAETEFAEGARYYFTYYGQLAQQARGERESCQFRPPVRPTAEDIKAFVENDATRAVIIAKQLDLDRVVYVLLRGFAREITDPAQMTLAFELARRTAPTNVVVRLAKAALNRDLPVDIYSFPQLLPEFEALGDSQDVEHALLHSLTRQESEFNAGAVSPAGARGLMQLMPATARLVAAQNKVKYKLSRLTNDPAYNVQLGAAFLERLISSYDGSYVMAVAAYNAGPGRVRSWSREFGDPRKSHVDPVDWVERIPFTETRNYVQRVLEGLQLYRCRFQKAVSPVLLVNDLHRGRPGSAVPMQAGASN